LVLRPDLTTPIARLAATKLKGEKPPYRLSYCGNAFRNERETGGAKLREFTQSGIELIGADHPLSDAEVITATVECLLAAGLENFQIDIGQVAFFKGLAAQLGLDAEQTEQLREMVDRKNSLAIEELVALCDADDALKALVVSLPSRFGGMEVVDGIDESLLGDTARSALDNLRQVYSIIRDYGMESYVSIDLGMVQSLNYYTGIIFKGFTHGVGYPVCGGGRYDTLLAEFDAPLSATGVAIGIDRVVSALMWQKKEVAVQPEITLIACDNDDRAAAYVYARTLREEGKTVQMWLDEGSRDDVKNFAKEAGIARVIWVTADGAQELD